MSDTTISVGNGFITLDKSMMDELSRGKYVVLRAITESGPCQDGMCQIIRDLKVSLEFPINDDTLMVFAGGGAFVAMDTNVYRSINKGREKVRVYKNLLGNLAVKGFVYTG